MEFTPQQLSGSGKYGYNVLIGNWNEDVALSKAEADAYQHFRDNKLRQLDRLQAITYPAMLPPNLSFSPTGFLHFGHVLAIKHAVHSAYVAVNLAEGISHASPTMCQEYQVSGSGQACSLRSSFLVLKPDGAAPVDEPVCFGDEVVLATNPGLCVNPKSGLCQFPLYLVSYPKGVNGVMGGSNEQEVRVLRSRNSGSSHYIRWRFERVDGCKNVVGSNARVPVNSENVQLIHCATGRALSMDAKFALLNQYGSELEVFCTLDHKKSKVHKLTSEFRGLTTGENRLPVESKNWWVVETAEEEGMGVKEEAEVITPETVLRLARKEVEGLGGIAVVEQTLHAADEAGDDHLDFARMELELIKLGMELSDDEFYCLLSAVGSSKTGVSISKLLAALQGQAG